MDDDKLIQFMQNKQTKGFVVQLGELDENIVPFVSNVLKSTNLKEDQINSFIAAGSEIERVFASTGITPQKISVDEVGSVVENN